MRLRNKFFNFKINCMKNYLKRIAENISLLLTIIALCVSGNVMAQTNTQIDVKPIASVVKSQGFYPASATKLQALSLIRNDSGSRTIITAGEAVHFTSGKKIILSPGFKAEQGSRFIADIKPLTSGTADLASTNDKFNKSIAVSPNPFSNSFTVLINSARDCKAQLTIYNSVGVKVKEQSNINLLKGVNTVAVNAADIASGAYMLEVNFGDSKIVSRIIKSN